MIINKKQTMVNKLKQTIVNNKKQMIIIKLKQTILNKRNKTILNKWKQTIIKEQTIQKVKHVTRSKRHVTLFLFLYLCCCCCCCCCLFCIFNSYYLCLYMIVILLISWRQLTHRCVIVGSSLVSLLSMWYWINISIFFRHYMPVVTYWAVSNLWSHHGVL